MGFAVLETKRISHTVVWCVSDKSCLSSSLKCGLHTWVLKESSTNLKLKRVPINLINY